MRNSRRINANLRHLPNGIEISNAKRTVDNRIDEPNDRCNRYCMLGVEKSMCSYHGGVSLQKVKERDLCKKAKIQIMKGRLFSVKMNLSTPTGKRMMYTLVRFVLMPDANFNDGGKCESW